MPMLEPDRDQIEIFVDAIFRHAQAGFVSLRAFAEGSNYVFRKTPIRIISNNLKFLCDAVDDDARRAAQNPKPIVFCPPLATFGNDKTAAEEDITEGFTVTVECDESPRRRAREAGDYSRSGHYGDQKRRRLERRQRRHSR